MTLTVKKMLNIPEFKDFKVIAGNSGMHRKISTVNVMDAPDIYNWLNGGEFIVTTAFVMKDEPMELWKLIKEINDAGASCLGIKIGRFVKKLPEKVITLANNLDFPIISIPINFSFSEVINPVLSDIVNNQARKLNFSERVHKSFTKLAINGGSIQEIIDVLSNLIEKDIVYYDVYFKKYYYAFKSEILKSKIKELTISNYVIDFPYYEIKIDNKVRGYIIYSDREDKHGLNEYNEIAIEHASTVLKFNLQKKISNQQIKTKYKDEFVQDLLFNNVNSLEEINKRAELYKLEFSERIFTIIFDIDNFKKQYLNIKAGINDKSLEVIKNKIYLLITGIINNYFPNNVSTSFSDNIVSIISSDNMDEENLKLIKKVMAKIRDRVREKADYTLTIGVGSIKKSPGKIYKSFKEAKLSVKLGRIIYEKDITAIYDELHSFKLIANIYKSSDARKFYEEYLNNLIKYDLKNDTDLIYILECLIKNNWNLKKTADNLFIHYNTMKNKYKKIKIIVGKDLDSFEEKFNIAFSLKLFKMVN